VPPSKDFANVAKVYAGAHYGKSLFWVMSELLFGFYLAEIYGIAPAVVGWMLAVFLLWDAFSDLFAGLVVSQRSISTSALASTQLLGAAISATTFMLIFLMPPLTEQGLIVYALSVGLAFRTAYTLFDMPQNVLLSRLAPDASSRLVLSATRTACSALAVLTISFASTLILANPDRQHRAHGFMIAAGVFVLIALVSSTILRMTIPSHPEQRQDPVPLHAVLRATVLNPPLAMLFLAIFCISIGWPLCAKLVPFFAAYVQGDAALAGLYFATIAVAAFGSQPIWALIGKHMGEGAVVIAGLLLLIAGAINLTVGAQARWGPIISLGALSAGNSALNTLIWYLLAERLRSQTLGAASDVLAFGIFTFSSKLALSLGGLILGWTLQQAAYQPGRPLPERGQTLLVLIMACAPVLSVCAAAVLAFATSANKLARK
jgi:glycoside/pentoside/hexuronide:cation symporter, GPH family